jgi:hypothetical protein
MKIKLKNKTRKPVDVKNIIKNKPALRIKTESEKSPISIQEYLTPELLSVESDGMFYFSMSNAMAFGVKEAVILNHILYWVKDNLVSKRRRYYKYDRYWTKLSVFAMAEYFPCWNERQIRTLLNNLVKKGAIIKRRAPHDEEYKANYYRPVDSVFNQHEALIERIHKEKGNGKFMSTD